MRSFLRAVLIVGIFAAALFTTSALLPDPRPATAEQIVAALPGVGVGWLDTLRRVAGPAAIDTISPLEFYDDCCDLLGLYERWHNLVTINAHLPAYAQFVRNAAAKMGACDDEENQCYFHPFAMITPAGVTAHEFGHRFQFGQRPHAVPQRGDALPVWARDAMDERFADRFARAMLALRGWDTPDSTDAVLNHRVRYLLLKSYWPVNEKVVPAPPAVNKKVSRAQADGTVVQPHL